MEIAALKKIIRNWPAYKTFIENQGIHPGRIKDLKELPIIDKHFISSAIHMVPLFKIRSIVPSSGSTGSDFSYGLFGANELKSTSYNIDSTLQSHFNTQNKKTLLLNMLPGAIALQSATLSVASIGVRTDTAISAIKAFSSSFDQLILLGEPLFIKKLIESGLNESVLWKHIPLFIIVGGEWTPESYTDYIERLIGPGRIFSSMGMAELGLNYFYETNETLLFRRVLFDDRSLLRTLFGNLDFCPMIFAYNEKETYVESVNEQGNNFESILLTTLNPNRALPLIRYKSGDKGKVLSRDKINSVMKAAGHTPIFNKSGPPVLAHFGRGKRVANIYPEMVKEIIFKTSEIASTTTGNFRLSENDNALHLQIQLKEGIHSDFTLENKYSRTFSILPVEITLYPLEQFPYSLDFERKVRYVSESNNCGKQNREKVGLSTAV